MSRFVLDCAIAMRWCFEDQGDRFSETVIERLRDDTAVVPALWRLEVANVLLMAERRRRISTADLRRFLGLLGGLPIQIASEGAAWPPDAVLALGCRHALPASDAEYLDLALRLAIPLATGDAGLARAARAEGVSLVRPR